MLGLRVVLLVSVLLNAQECIGVRTLEDKVDLLGKMVFRQDATITKQERVITSLQGTVAKQERVITSLQDKLTHLEQWRKENDLFVAFSAGTNTTESYEDGDKINFPYVLSHAGDWYNPVTSIFTCPVTNR